MRRWHNQRGEVKLGLILSLVILVLAVVAAIKAIPVMFSVYELDDFAKRQAESADRLSDTAIAEQILARAQTLRLPLSRENLSVKRQGRHITVEYNYTVEINLPLYTHSWVVSRRVDRTIFVT